jgi:hypothetical protein
MTAAILLMACVVLAGAVVALAVALRNLRADLAAGLAAVRSELAHVEEARTSPTTGIETTAPYVITRLGDVPDEPAPALEAKLFADIVLRESVVKAASWAYGVRRGLAPENRNRIWFEMRREVKRARKERRAEEREAIREWRARHRAAVRHEGREEDAA